MENVVNLILQEIQSVRQAVQQLQQGQIKLEQSVQQLQQGQAKLEQNFQRLQQGQAKLEQNFQQLQQGQTNLEQNFQRLHQSQLNLERNQETLSAQINEIHQAIVRIEDGQPKDIYALLHNIYKAIQDKEYDIAALNKRVFRLEAEFERLNRQ